MDPSPSPFSRAGRMFWSAWYYVTVAVGKYLRPEVIDNDGQEPEGSNAEINVKVEGAEETQTVPITISAKNIPRSTVAWEECDSNNGVGPAKEKIQYIVQFTSGSDGHTLENDEGEIGEQIADTGLHVAKEMATEEEEVENDCKQHLIVKVTGTLTDENEELDHFGSSNFTHVTLSDNMEETNRKIGLEETGGMMAHDERQNADETLRNVPVKEWNEGEEVLTEDAAQHMEDAPTVRCSGSEGYADQLCTSVSPERDSNIFREDLALARQEEGTGMEHETAMTKETESERHTSVSEQASTLSDSEDESNRTSDEGLVEHGAADVQKAVVLCEEILDENSEVTAASEAAQDAQLQMSRDKRAAASDHYITVAAHTMGETLLKTANDLEVTEDGSIAEERGQDVEIDVDDQEKDNTKNNILDCGIEAQDSAEDDLVTEHIQVSKPITENTEILNTPLCEGGNQDAMAALLQTVTQTENVAVENKNTELSDKSEHIDHLTLADGKAQLTGINIAVDEEKTRPDEEKFSSSEADTAKKEPGNLAHVTLSDDMEETQINSGLEKEIGEIMAHDEGHKVDETFRTDQVKDGNAEEEVVTEDEAQSLRDACAVLGSESEESSGQLCRSLSPEDDNIYREDVALAIQEEEKGNGMKHDAVVRNETERHTSVSKQASALSDSEDENDLTSDEGLGEHGGADVHKTVLLCEEILDENSDITASELAQDTQLQITYKRAAASVHGITVGAQVMGETLLKTENNDANDLNTAEDGSTAVEREQCVEKIDAQIDDEGKEMSKGIKLDWHFEVESRAEDDMGTEHIQVSEPMTENMEIRINRAQCEGGNQNAITALLGTVTQTTEYVAVENQTTELLGIGHLTVTDGKTHLTDQDFPKIRPEDKVSDIINKNESALAPIAVKTESNNGGEIMGVLRSTSPEISDGLVVVPLEPNSVVCEETQEGVPEYDNNRHELYEEFEDTTQRILEVGDYEEMQTTQLPEEVGSKELESFITTACSGEAGHLFIHGEEQSSKLESAMHIQNMFDMVAERHTGTLCPTDTELPREKEEPSTEPMDETPAQVSAYISTAELGQVDASLETGAKHSEHVSQTDASSQDETWGTDTELLVKTEMLLAEVNNEPDRKSASVMDTQRNNTTTEENVDKLSEETEEYHEAELHMEKVTGFVHEPIDPTVLEENCSQAINLPGSTVETRIMEQPSATRPILNEEKEVPFMAMDVQDAGLNMQDIAGSEMKKTTSEKEDSPEIINLQKMKTATCKTTDGEENAGSETDIDINTDQLLESINHEMFDKHHSKHMEKMDVGFYNESLDIKSEPELITPKETEITIHGKADKVTELLGRDVSGMGGHETDDEILDLWIDTVLCKDANNSEPQIIREPTEREPKETKNEETRSGPDEEMSKLTEKEPQWVSINNEEPETELALGSETEILETSPPLLQSEYTAGGQFSCEGASAENETLVLELSGAEVFQAIHETADSMSEIVISVKSSEIEDGDMKGTQDLCVQEDQSTHEIHTQTGFLKNDATTEAREDELSYQSQENRETDIVKMMGADTGLQVIYPMISDSGLQEKTNLEISKGMEEKTCAPFQGEAVNSNTEDKRFGAIELNITNEMKEVHSGKNDKSLDSDSEVLGRKSEPGVVLEGRTLTESDLHKKTCLEGQDQVCDVLEAHSGRSAASSPVQLSTAYDAEELATPLPTPSDQLELDFTPQKTIIAIKNPHVRPPMDPRAVIQMPSVELTPQKSPGRLPMKVLAAVPMGGLGLGIKLPGFGAGFPGLKKTNVSREDNRTEDCPQKDTETKLEVKDVSPEPVAVLEGRVLTESDLHKKTCLEGQDQVCDVLEAHSGRKAASSPVELSTADNAEELAMPLPTPGDQLEFSTLDFTPQKTRIAIKNPHVRPPKDPRALLQMPSLEPTPSKPSVRLPVKRLAGVPMGGLGIGIKLPGIGAGFPVLKKTNVSREETLTKDCPEKETETKKEVNEGSPMQDVAKHKPKWMPPRQPGFGNPLMSELKNKLKKTTKE